MPLITATNLRAEYDNVDRLAGAFYFFTAVTLTTGLTYIVWVLSRGTTPNPGVPTAVSLGANSCTLIASQPNFSNNNYVSAWLYQRGNSATASGEPPVVVHGEAAIGCAVVVTEYTNVAWNGVIRGSASTLMIVGATTFTSPALATVGKANNALAAACSITLNEDFVSTESGWTQVGAVKGTTPNVSMSHQFRNNVADSDRAATFNWTTSHVQGAVIIVELVNAPFPNQY